MANKFHAKRTEQDGYKFDSLAERRRYNELALLERAGEISELKPHPRYVVFEAVLEGKREKITYIPDFQYLEGGRTVCEDVKGGKATQTDVFRIKALLFRAAYPDIDFRIVER